MATTNITSSEAISKLNGVTYAWITVQYTHERNSSNQMVYYVKFTVTTASGYYEAPLGLTATINGTTKTGSTPNVGAGYNASPYTVTLGPWTITRNNTNSITGCSAGISGIQYSTNGVTTRSWSFSAVADA